MEETLNLGVTQRIKEEQDALARALKESFYFGRNNYDRQLGYLDGVALKGGVDARQYTVFDLMANDVICNALVEEYDIKHRGKHAHGEDPAKQITEELRPNFFTRKPD